MDRRAQVEMIGVLIIVIIVVSAMLFYLVYKMSNPSADVKHAYVNEELATNLLIAMTRVNVKECPSHTIGRLVADCAKGPGSRVFCNGRSSCEAADDAIEEVLYSSTAISELGKNFSIRIEKAGIEHLRPCLPGAEKIQGSQPLPITKSESVELLLDVCDG